MRPYVRGLVREESFDGDDILVDEIEIHNYEWGAPVLDRFEGWQDRQSRAPVLGRGRLLVVLTGRVVARFHTYR
jgi:hypothetical protein